MLFRGKYRIPSARLIGHDYAWPGRYFVTICTHGRVRWFGKIRNGIMGLNDAGCVVADCWTGIPDHYENVRLGPWIIMPDHLHGIIELVPAVEACDSHASTERMPHVFVRKLIREYRYAIGRQTNVPIPRPKPGSLPSIVGQFKSVSTKRIHALGYAHFRWQPRFHDHVIRHDGAYARIARYIRCNPITWHGAFAYS